MALYCSAAECMGYSGGRKTCGLCPECWVKLTDAQRSALQGQATLPAGWCPRCGHSVRPARRTGWGWLALAAGWAALAAGLMLAGRHLL